MSKQESGSEGANYNSNLNSDMFFGHFNRNLFDYIPLFHFLFKTRSKLNSANVNYTTNDSRLFEVFQREAIDCYFFSFLSSKKYVPVPPPAVLSCYLRISGAPFTHVQKGGYSRNPKRHSHEIYDGMLRIADASKEFKENETLNLQDALQLECKNFPPPVTRFSMEANEGSNTQKCPSSREPRKPYPCDLRIKHRLPRGLTAGRRVDDVGSHGNKLSLTRRRPYTAFDLASAVKAICSGELGTRRAASMYGIPRSTLRNKICKLNEIRKHEETLRGGQPISLSDFFHQFASSGKPPKDGPCESETIWRPSTVATPYGLASVFKVW
ncbi:unnamed protein product [Hydatigera taeniaeformis]|uniref:HTH psq-type domain-containing protein n=1 Tax=Hydatigena taeniaeformis TaxID=6205 RepID=A0A0R3X270_HYDTA|nr:unnamed protein product [Hydatigera taeniaeformis]